MPKGELHPCVTGKRKENQSKNRYTTIFPCTFEQSTIITIFAFPFLKIMKTIENITS